MRDVYQICADEFDDDAQLMKTAEEAGELVQAICKYLVWKLYKRHPDRVGTVRNTEGQMRLSIIKEILDVDAMLKQIRHIKFLDDPASWELFNTQVTMSLWKKLEEVTGKTPEELRNV